MTSPYLSLGPLDLIISALMWYRDHNNPRARSTQLFGKKNRFQIPRRAECILMNFKSCDDASAFETPWLEVR